MPKGIATPSQKTEDSQAIYRRITLCELTVLQSMGGILTILDLAREYAIILFLAESM